MGETGPLEIDFHTGVQEYFQIDCRTGCPGVFSNWLSHAGVQEYFLIDCRTRVSRSIFKLDVARGGKEAKNFLIDCHTQVFRSIFKLNVVRSGHGAKNFLIDCRTPGQGVFSNLMLYTRVQEN